jgi:hypothetical protein
MKPVEKPLLESALLAWQLAGQFCCKDPATGESCEWNHGLRWKIAGALRAG